jgi:hypothetical protein
MSFSDETYFCMDLTEGEHFVVEDMLRTFCNENGMELVYYREIKTGHIPCIREVKVRHDAGNRGLFLRFMDEQVTWDCARRWEDGKLVSYKGEVAV